jgi:hypothetical protein
MSPNWSSAGTPACQLSIAAFSGGYPINRPPTLLVDTPSPEVFKALVNNHLTKTTEALKSF